MIIKLRQYTQTSLHSNNIEVQVTAIQKSIRVLPRKTMINQPARMSFTLSSKHQSDANTLVAYQDQDATHKDP